METIINIIKDGPAIVFSETPIKVVLDEKEYETGTKAAICRCGKTNNAPFCDGSHKLKKEEEKSKDDSL